MSERLLLSPVQHDDDEWVIAQWVLLRQEFPSGMKDILERLYLMQSLDVGAARTRYQVELELLPEAGRWMKPWLDGRIAYICPDYGDFDCSIFGANVAVNSKIDYPHTDIRTFQAAATFHGFSRLVTEYRSGVRGGRIKDEITRWALVHDCLMGFQTTCGLIAINLDGTSTIPVDQPYVLFQGSNTINRCRALFQGGVVVEVEGEGHLWFVIPPRAGAE